MIFSETQQRYRNVITALLLMLVAWAFYLPSAKYGWVYFDDVRILQDHPELYGQPGLGADLKAIFVTCFPREEPLLARDVSWAVDGLIFGFNNPFGYHLDNVLLHGVEVALMFAFLLGTTRRYSFALVIGIAYLLLAVNTEPVAWIMGRKDILSAIFMLLALCAQTRRLTTKSMVAQCGWYAATMACFVIALFSKISVLSFPLVLFLHAMFFPYLRGERSPGDSFSWGFAILREMLLIAPAVAVSGIVFVWYQRTLTVMGVFDRGYTAHGLAHLWNLLMVDPMAFWLYLRQIFLPQHLSVLYTWPTLETTYPLWQVVLSLATVAVIAGVGIWLFCRRKDIFFYYAAFFVLMIPYVNLAYVGIWVADRYVYFSVFCVLAIAVTLGEAAFRSNQTALRIGALTACIVFAGVNLCQKLSYERVWRNAETLWAYHIALSQPSHVAYENLAAYYYAGFSDAHAQNNLPLMVLNLRKMGAVVDAGLEKFWPDRQQPPPPDISYLFFLQSLVQQVGGQPQEALQSLLMSDNLRPRFGATDLNLARLYRQLAATAQTPQQQQSDLRDAKSRYEEYVGIEFRGRPAPPEVQKELSDVQAECANPPPLSKAPAK
ncbi:MAG TPA: hypothetical protein VNU95_08085 [Candidatus Acidoferrales bacterium]|jgi:hypothetical protein|nr:hypothetical protein [Candidatus Acidoferrales bacterium]